MITKIDKFVLNSFKTAFCISLHPEPFMRVRVAVHWQRAYYNIQTALYDISCDIYIILCVNHTPSSLELRAPLLHSSLTLFSYTCLLHRLPPNKQHRSESLEVLSKYPQATMLTSNEVVACNITMQAY